MLILNQRTKVMIVYVNIVRVWAMGANAAGSLVVMLEIERGDATEVALKGQK